MKFRVMDNKTGKDANPYEIALYEEWAQRLVYCDMEGFAITENGDLMLADECGNSVYCDSERFKVVFEEERPHSVWIPRMERLPDKLGDYLVTDNSGNVYCSTFDYLMEEKCFGYEDDGYFVEDDTVVAWMPMPEPYKGGDEK